MVGGSFAKSPTDVLWRDGWRSMDQSFAGRVRGCCRLENMVIQ